MKVEDQIARSAAQLVTVLREDETNTTNNVCMHCFGGDGFQG
jgi:hypothetical protein